MMYILKVRLSIVLWHIFFGDTPTNYESCLWSLRFLQKTGGQVSGLIVSTIKESLQKIIHHRVTQSPEHLFFLLSQAANCFSIAVS